MEKKSIFPLTHAQIKKTIMESNLVLLFQFLLMFDGKWVGFERHVLKKWQDKEKIYDGEDKDGAFIEAKKKNKYHYEYTDKSQILILHRSPEGLFFGKELYGSTPLITDEDVTNVWHAGFTQDTLFRGIRHNKKVQITEKNINSVVNQVYKIMSGWRWDMVGNHYSAGEGWRQFKVSCVGRDNAYEEHTSYSLDIETLDHWKIIKDKK